MNREAIKERIRFYTEYLKILWIVVIALSGGIAGLFRVTDTWEETFDINKLLKKLEKEEEDGSS